MAPPSAPTAPAFPRKSIAVQHILASVWHLGHLADSSIGRRNPKGLRHFYRRSRKFSRYEVPFCMALTVNATHSKRSVGASSGQIDHSHELAAALNLDMSNWWQLNAETYLGRVSKDQIIESLSKADKFRRYDVANMKRLNLQCSPKSSSSDRLAPAILRCTETA